MINEIEERLREATCLCLGVFSDGDDGLVRLTWLSDDAPFPSEDVDVVYLFVETADEPISQQRDVITKSSSGDLVETITEYLLVVQARWVAYGPEASKHAFLIRDGLFTPRIHAYNRSNNLALVTNPVIPRRAPEHINGKWRERGCCSQPIP